MTKYYLKVHNVRYVPAKAVGRGHLPVYRTIGPFASAESAAAYYDKLVERKKVHTSHFACIDAVTARKPKAAEGVMQ